jgi:hypothetical protein
MYDNIDCSNYSYKCIELYGKGWVHMVDQDNNIIGKLPIWKVYRKRDVNKLLRYITDLHLSYKLAQRIHAKIPKLDCILEALYKKEIFNEHNGKYLSLI